METEFAGALVEAMQACLAAEDPGARAVPYLVSAGTDAKAWDRPGIDVSGSFRFGCHLSWTSGRCSTASTSGYRLIRLSSVPGFRPLLA